MNMHFVFCHGFGFNNHFWDIIAPYFNRDKCTFIDLGYFKSPTFLSEFSAQKTIGIGHSLGLLKLMDLHKNFDALVGLNSFINFLGNTNSLREKRRLELSILKQSFIKNPEQTLKTFYKRCGVPELIERSPFTELDQYMMLNDINFLKEARPLPPIPTLILRTEDDIIVPQKLIEDNFSSYPNVKIDTMHHGKHGLGFTNPYDVYKRIRSFLNDTFSE